MDWISTLSTLHVLRRSHTFPSFPPDVLPQLAGVVLVVPVGGEEAKVAESELRLQHLDGNVTGWGRGGRAGGGQGMAGVDFVLTPLRMGFVSSASRMDLAPRPRRQQPPVSTWTMFPALPLPHP